MTEENDRKIILYSYRKVWFVEKKIYAIQNIVLPVPVNPYELLEFIIAAGVMLFLCRLIPALENVPSMIRYVIIPYIIVKYLMKLKLDGKNPVKYFISLVPYLITKGFYVEHFQSYPDKQEKIKLSWFCSKG